MSSAAAPALGTTLTRALCLVVLATIAIAAAYSAWIWLSNFNRIGV
jgi:hypothetical protein